MQKKSITNKITPCGNLPFSVMYWFLKNIKLNSESDRQFLLSRVSQNGFLPNDAWKVLINSGKLEVDSAMTKPEFLLWFENGKGIDSNQLKMIIEGYKIGNYNPNDEYGVGWTEISDFEEFEEKIIKKVIDYVGGVGDLPLELSDSIGKYYATTGGFTLDKNLATNFKPIIGIAEIFDPNNTTEGLSGKTVYDYLEKNKINGLYYFDKNTITEGFFIDADSGNLNANGAFWTSDFIDTKGYKEFRSSAPFSFIVFFDSNKNYVSGIALGGQTEINVPLNAQYFRFSNNSAPTDNQIKVGFLDAWNYPYEKREVVKFDQNIEVFEITAYRNVADFNSIQNLIDSIEDASFAKRYIVKVPKGNWFECNLHGKEFVEIVGEDMNLTVIYCDGNSTKLTPENYHFQTYKNTALNAIPQQFKHCIFAKNPLKISNITIKVNDCKYSAHLDDVGISKAEFSNVIFKETGANVNYPVGIGMTGGQEMIFDGCVFETDLIADKKGILFHNTNNQDSACKLSVKNSLFKNCHYIMVDELGSDQNDVCDLLNCESTLSNPNIIVMVDQYGDGNTFWVNPLTGLSEPNPTNVPYSIKVNTIGTYVEYIGFKPFSGFEGNPRPLFLNYLRGKHDGAF